MNDKVRAANNPVLRARHNNQLRKQQAKLVYASIDPSDGSRRMIPEPAAIAEDAIIEETSDAELPTAARE